MNKVQIRKETFKVTAEGSAIQVRRGLTLSVGLHPGRRVDGVSKQTVPGHLQAHHAGTHWPCNGKAKSTHCRFYSGQGNDAVAHDT